MLTAALFGAVLSGQIADDARLMRTPDIYGDKIVFQYGGDLWLVGTSGGVARRITTSPGIEVNPKFSPDGSRIAFSADYDGNLDVYVVSSEGGEPKRLTSHPKTDQVLDWSADGKNIIFRSPRESKVLRYAGAFMVSADGGTPRAMPMTECGQLAPNPDGSTYAYNRLSAEGATWKRYRGGLQSWISFYDTSTGRYWEMKHDRSAQLWPMWVDGRVFYVNDSDGIRNLYVYNPKDNTSKQVTKFDEYDISSPSTGSGKIVYARDGHLWLFDVASAKTEQVKVQILSDLPETRGQVVSLAQIPSDVTISPSGVRVAVEARGEIFSVPTKEGLTRNISNTPGARERYPRWSPDGKWILFASDKSGEYEFFLRKSDLSEPAKLVASSAGAFPMQPTWAPDSKKFMFPDSEFRLNIVNIETGDKTVLPQTSLPSYQDATWSADSKWVAYTSGRRDILQVAVYNLEKKQETVISDGKWNDTNPVFDATGRYLFFTSNRNVGFTTDAYEFLPVATNPTVVLGCTLRPETPSPFAPKDDNEKISDPKPAGEQPKPDATPPQEPPAYDLAGMKKRVFSIPLPASSYTLMAAPAGRLIYFSDGAVFMFDMNSKSPLPLIGGINGLEFTPGFDKFVYLAGQTVGVLPAAPGGQAGAGRVNLSDMTITTEPRAEWKESYWEAWRYIRDNFWNTNMNGMNWRAVGERYAKWLPYVAHRSDLDQLLWELLADLGTGHSYLSAPPASRLRPVPVGLLGADYNVTADGVQFKKIYAGQSWDSARRGPLGEPGLNVHEGDYLISIDGVRVTANTSVDDLLQGKAEKVVEIRVNTGPTENGARKLLVRTTADDAGIRYADWIESNRDYVDQQSQGKIGYIHVPDTATGGFVEFWRMFYTQLEKDALIIDERYNGGGFIPDYFIEKLTRTPLGGFVPRGTEIGRIPGGSHLGPKVMLMNAYAGSGGDAFPYFFRKRKIGPLIGTRTWGGLIGITGNRDLMIGGSITVPQFAAWDYDENGNTRWVVENEGVAPDMEVDNRPDLIQGGADPQLDAAIKYLRDELKRNPVKRPKTPKYPGSGG